MMMPSLHRLLALLLILPLLSYADAATTHTREMVVTPHPLATAAGQDVLERGGTVTDAIVAVQTVLTLVEPQASGIGGGGFAVLHNATTGKTTTFDGRETAPAAATEDRFASMPNFFVAWQSGLSVGVPGIPRLLEALHQRGGRLPWKTLFEPAQELATNGFELSERTSSLVDFLLSFNANVLGLTNCTTERLLFRDLPAFDYFVDAETCTAKPAGTVMTNQNYSETMTTLANGGMDAFYTGAIASDIAAAVQNDVAIPGDLTTQDLENYKVIEREPVCFEYRGLNICGMGPPTSGGIATAQMLGMLESFDFSTLDPFDPLNEEFVHMFTQANRLAFADRSTFATDSDFISVPVAEMIDKDYLAARAELIGESDMGIASAGPIGVDTNTAAADARTKDTGTSHISIVDRYGNALSMTSSIEAPFGNGVMVRGFLLNNELTDFSFAPSDAVGNSIANRVEANKRPRSSMSPTIAFDADGSVKLLTGSVGGATIIGHTVQSLINIIDFGLDPQATVEVPHYQNNNENDTTIEKPSPGVIREDYNATDLAESLTARGHTVSEDELSSGLAIILVTEEGTLVGGADKRRDVAVGGADCTTSGTTLHLSSFYTFGLSSLFAVHLVHFCI